MPREVGLKGVTDRLFYEILMSLREGAVIGISGGVSIEPFLRYAVANLQFLEGTKFILTDERCVGDSHPFSNYGQARSILGDGVSVISTKTVFDENWAFIDFDLVIMGFGVDGHFASIFPNLGQLETVIHDCSFKTKVPVGNPCCVRYSLSEDVILGAAKIVLMVNSELKSQAIDQCKAGNMSSTPLAQLFVRRPDAQIIKYIN